MSTEKKAEKVAAAEDLSVSPVDVGLDAPETTKLDESQKVGGALRGAARRGAWRR